MAAGTTAEQAQKTFSLIADLHRRAEDALPGHYASGNLPIVFNILRRAPRSHFELGLIEWRRGNDPTAHMNACVDAGVRYLSEIERLCFEDTAPQEAVWSLVYAAAFLLGRSFPLVSELSAEARSNAFWAPPELIVNALYDVAIDAELATVLDKVRDRKDAQLVCDTFSVYHELLAVDGRSEQTEVLVRKAEENYLRRKKGTAYLAYKYHGGGRDNVLVVDRILAAIIKKIGWPGNSIHKWQWVDALPAIDPSWAAASQRKPEGIFAETVGGVSPPEVVLPSFPRRLPMYDEVPTKLKGKQLRELSAFDRGMSIFVEEVRQRKTEVSYHKGKRHLAGYLGSLGHLPANYLRIAALQWRHGVDPRDAMNAALDAGEDHARIAQELGVAATDVASDISAMLHFVAYLVGRRPPGKVGVVWPAVGQVHQDMLQLTVATLNSDPSQLDLTELKTRMTGQAHVDLAERTYLTYLELLGSKSTEPATAKPQFSLTKLFASRPRTPGVSELVHVAEANYAARSKDQLFGRMNFIFGGRDFNAEQVDWQLSAILKKIGWQGESRHLWRWD